MTTPTHYNQFPAEFEPYKICNNANFNGNLQQIFQYVARRKHEGNEIGDLKEVLDFVRFEEERIRNINSSQAESFYRDKWKFIEGSLLVNKKTHNAFIEFCKQEDSFLHIIYIFLLAGSIASISIVIMEEIHRLESLTIEENL